MQVSFAPNRLCLIALAIVVLAGCGCSRLRNRGLTLELRNTSGTAISNLAFEFPGGSFGVDSIAPGVTRARWLKPTKNGPLKIEFDDVTGHHTAQPLVLHAGDSGTVVLSFDGKGGVAVESSTGQKR